MKAEYCVINNEFIVQFPGLSVKWFIFKWQHKSIGLFNFFFSFYESSVTNVAKFRFKDSQHCTRLIAEHLDPEGKVSSVQVSKFGLKCASKKRLCHAGKSIHNGSNKLDGDKQTMDNAGSKSNILEPNLSS